MYNIMFPLERPELQNIEESYEEEIARKPSLERRLAEGNQKVTLEAYAQEY